MSTPKELVQKVKEKIEGKSLYEAKEIITKFLEDQKIKLHFTVNMNSRRPSMEILLEGKAFGDKDSVVCKQRSFLWKKWWSVSLN